MNPREYLIAMYSSEAAAVFLMILMWFTEPFETVLKLGFTALIAAMVSIYFHMAYVYLKAREPSHT